MSDNLYTDMGDGVSAAIVRDLSVQAQGSEILETDQIYAWLSPQTGQVQLVDLTGDEYREQPKRKRGTISVDDVASFATYYQKHKHNGVSEIFAAPSAHKIVGVLNAHAVGEAGWQDHRVILQLRLTESWVAWIARDRKWLSQLEFAEFLEDRIEDIAPGEVSAAKLLELAQEFTAQKTVQFQSGSRLRDGTVQIQYVESIEQTGGTKGGHVSLPQGFHVGIRPFDDSEPMQVRARLRYRIANRALHLQYLLDDPAGIVRDAMTGVSAKIAEVTGDTVMNGSCPQP